jgi:uncharacterized protein (DUF2147 family)
MVTLAAVLGLAGGAALADPIVGTWRTQPDRKDLVSLIRVSACGDAICGTIAKAYDKSGQEVRTQHVGKRLFWGLKPEGGGAYSDGTVQVPLLDVTARASATLQGNTLRVTGCKGPVCQGETWVRVN